MRLTGEKETHETNRREGNSRDAKVKRLMRQTGQKENHEADRTEGDS